MRNFLSFLSMLLFLACSSAPPKPAATTSQGVLLPPPSPQVLQIVKEQCREWGKGWKLASQGSLAYCHNPSLHLYAYAAELPQGFLDETPSLLDRELALQDLLEDGFIGLTGYLALAPWTPCSQTPLTACSQGRIKNQEQVESYALTSILDDTGWLVIWGQDTTAMPSIDSLSAWIGKPN